jgi:hypothetical protein
MLRTRCLVLPKSPATLELFAVRNVKSSEPKTYETTVTCDTAGGAFKPAPKIRVLILVALFAGCTRVSAPNDVPPSQAEVERVLRKNTQSLLDAIAPGDTAVWNRLLDSAAIIVDENDEVRTKSEILAGLKPLAPGLLGDLAIDNFLVKLHGDVAVVTHEDNEYLDYHGQILRSRFRSTDVWKRQGNAWREISAMALAVQKDPPAMALDRKAVCAFNGRYAMTDSIAATLQCAGDSLVMKRYGHPDRAFRPETRDVFFEPGQPRTRRIFQYDTLGRAIGFVDRREGRDISWTRTSGAAR